MTTTTKTKAADNNNKRVRLSPAGGKGGGVLRLKILRPLLLLAGMMALASSPPPSGIAGWGWITAAPAPGTVGGARRIVVAAAAAIDTTSTSSLSSSSSSSDVGTEDSAGDETAGGRGGDGDAVGVVAEAGKMMMMTTVGKALRGRGEDGTALEEEEDGGGDGPTVLWEREDAVSFEGTETVAVHTKVEATIHEEQDYDGLDTSGGLASSMSRSLQGAGTCAPISCVPDLHFASVAQARFDPENQFYDDDNSLCKASFGTVVILAGVQACQNAIASVKFQWTNPSGAVYNRLEGSWPYTLFSDSYPTSFATRVLAVGTHVVTAAIQRSNGCVALSVTFRFTVSSQACPAGTNLVKTRAPTKSPTKSPTKPSTPLPTRFPTVPPTKSPTRPPTVPPTKPPTRPPTLPPTKPPTRPPTKSPTQPPTTQQDAAFCRSLEYFQGHLYGSNLTRNSWDAHNEHLKSMPRCCGGKLPHLASITSADEFALLYFLAPFTYSGVLGVAFQESVIGLRILQDENGTYIGPPAWTTGEAVAGVKYYYPYEPGKECFYMDFDFQPDIQGQYGIRPMTCNVGDFTALYEYDCEETVPGATVTYPGIPDGDFCTSLTYHNGHLYQAFRDAPNSPEIFTTFGQVTNPFFRSQYFRPCCGGKLPHLVTIGDAAENEFVQQLRLQETAPELGWDPSKPRGNDLMIGLFDVLQEGTFEWVNGENVSYTNWESPLRNDDLLLQDEYDCVVIKQDGTWRTSSCGYSDSKIKAVFEWDCEIPIPEPRNTIPSCGSRYASFGGHYYSVRQSTAAYQQSFSDAKTAEFPCCGAPPKLVSIESAAENAFVASLLPAGTEAWMGLHDLRVEGRYEWGIPAHPTSIFDASAPSLINSSYTNWAVGEPDDGGPRYQATEDCISIVGGTGLWHDRSCNDPKWYIIEFDCQL